MPAEEHPITLGYIGDFKTQRLLHRRYFPSKVGGKPAWLDPINLPRGDSVLVCQGQNCAQQPLTFILQVYAGRDHPDDAFHRTVYIFGCQWCSETFVALRCQLPRYNQFYPPSPADQDDRSTTDDCLDSRCCPACGIPTNKRTHPKVKELMEEEKLEGDCQRSCPKTNCVNPINTGSIAPQMHHRCKVALEWSIQSPIPVIFEERELEIDIENLDPSIMVSPCEDMFWEIHEQDRTYSNYRK